MCPALCVLTGCSIIVMLTCCKDTTSRGKVELGFYLCAIAVCQMKIHALQWHTVAWGQGFPEVLMEGCGTMLPVKLEAVHRRGYRIQLPIGPTIVHCRTHSLLG